MAGIFYSERPNILLRMLSVFTASTGEAEEVFTSIGYRNWKYATGKQGLFKKHNNCHVHKQAMVS